MQHAISATGAVLQLDSATYIATPDRKLKVFFADLQVVSLVDTRCVSPSRGYHVKGKLVNQFRLATSP